MRKKKNNKRFETPRLNMKAAGIDIAASSDHYVAVSPEPIFVHIDRKPQ